MGMPRDFLFVRHGESEANILHNAEKEGRAIDPPDGLRDRPDWMHRLSCKGVEQARIAGEWITENIGDISKTFDACYTSHFIRARETAAHLGGNDLKWREYNTLHERSWGYYGTIPRDQRPLAYPQTQHLKEVAPLYVQFDGGESLADSVTLRVRDFLDTVKRKWTDQRVIVVTHGEVISMIRYVLEKMLPETWHDVDKDKSQEIGNCAILWYTRVNPDDPNDVRPYLGWRRIIQPDDLANSPFGGKWQKLPDTTFKSGGELLASVDKIPRLF